MWVVIIFIIFLLIWVYVKVSDPTLTEEIEIPIVQSLPNTEAEPKLTETCILDAPIISSLLTLEQADEEDTIEEQAMQAERSPPVWSPIQGSFPKQSIGEAECYRVFCNLFGKDNVRVQCRNIPWLINPLTKRHLELDIYVPSRGIACEYNGEQHYHVVSRFHKYGQESLKYQIYKDNVKVDLCDANGVYLITVPYWEKNIQRFILSSMPGMPR